ncbi:MAG: glycosyltransferase family 4 protein [Marinosulfonomonas sp.]|nr:glycosyltransferase family 4 protein [Marinosulfonomonas sp.]
MSLVQKARKRASLWVGMRIKKLALTFHTYFCTKSLEMVFYEEMAEWQPDIVHSHDGITLPVAAKVAEKCGAQLVFDSHELESHRNPPLSWVRKRQVIALEKKYLPKADVVFTVGHEIADYLSGTYKIKKPTVLYNSPHKNPTPIPERWDTFDRDDIRNELRLNNKSFLLVHTGNVTFNRGIEQAIVALAKMERNIEVVQKYPLGVHLALVGNRVPAVVNRINSLIKKYNVQSRIHYIDPVAPNSIVKYIGTADACLIPVIPLVLSYEFAMPNKLFEGVLAGLPIIASDLCELKRFVADNQLGVLYQADNTDKMAEALKEIILGAQKYRRTGKRHAELVTKFSWEAQEKLLLKEYRNLNLGQ